MLVKLTNVKRVIEVGTFASYSGLCLAEGIPGSGEILCFDVSKDFIDLARKYWKLTELDNKIKLTLGNAVEKLQELVNDKANENAFDLAYADADKPNYINYYEMLLKLMKPYGWIVFDNVLWSYKVVEEESEKDDQQTKAFRKLNNL
jgi:predicted O-methyltransferase YrrM